MTALSRRSFFAYLGGALAAAAAAISQRAAAAPAKVSKAAAQYKDRPKGPQRCEICVNFEPPNQCRFVRGSISKTGWCKFFAGKENAH